MANKYYVLIVIVAMFTVSCFDDDSNPVEPNRRSVPYPPSDLTVTFDAPNEDFILTWKDNSDNEDGFRICHTMYLGGSSSASADVPENMTSCSIKEWGAPRYEYHELATYEFRVLAFNLGGESPVSNIVTYP
ncbi:MAG: fibronectin type III domain-containing protein [Calditrichaeota bacterium]|nr:fibronectin type III domain-containing protein [Calditrichota bacterium]